MAQIGRPRKYQSAKVLREAVEAYFESISYRVPAVVSTPTGEVDDKGRVVWATKMLTEHMDGSGKPKTLVRYLEPPTLESLCLFLGISRSTWSQYSQDEKLGPVLAWAKDRVRADLVGRLYGKHVAGIIFNLQNNFGYQERREVSLDRETRRAMVGAEMTMEEKRKLLEDIAKDFCGDEGEPDGG